MAHNLLSGLGYLSALPFSSNCSVTPSLEAVLPSTCQPSISDSCHAACSCIAFNVGCWALNLVFDVILLVLVGFSRKKLCAVCFRPIVQRTGQPLNLGDRNGRCLGR